MPTSARRPKAAYAARVDEGIDPYKPPKIPTAPVGADYISARAGIATAYPGAYTMRPYTHDPGFAVGAAFMAARTAVRSAEISRESQLPHGRG